MKSSAEPRLDVYLVAKRPGLSRQGASQIVKTGSVKVNGRVQLKPSYRLKAADKVLISYKQPKNYQYPVLSIPVLYEDDNCVVIDKPAGLLSHSKGGFNPEATIETWLKPKLHGLSGQRAGIVHRLDRGTSGVMICAKNSATLKFLQRQFSDRLAQKTYQALVVGTPKESEAIIDMPIERHPRHRQTFRTSPTGRRAVTHYKVLESGNGVSLLELRPETGRTHQIRVHLAKIGYPIVGDHLYGGPPAGRLYLHATSLELQLPVVGVKLFAAQLPDEFRMVLHGKTPNPS